MAAGVFKVTDNFREKMGDSTIDWENDTFFHVLLGAGHTFARSNGLFSNISGDEIADGDYARQEMTGGAVSLSSGKVVFTSGDANFGAQVDITAKFHAIVRAANGASVQASDIVVGMRDLNIDGGGTDPAASDDGPFISRPHATDGWFYIPQPA
jgi:hypothetical protein